MHYSGASYARQPLSTLRPQPMAAAGGCVKPVPCENPHKVVRSDCHLDCIQHCTHETKTALKCSQPCGTTGDVAVAVVGHKGGYGIGGAGALIIWFIVIFVIAWLILYAIKPRWLLRDHDGNNTSTNGWDNCQVDTGRIVVAAILIALIIVILIFLLGAIAIRR